MGPANSITPLQITSTSTSTVHITLKYNYSFQVSTKTELILKLKGKNTLEKIQELAARATVHIILDLANTNAQDSWLKLISTIPSVSELSLLLCNEITVVGIAALTNLPSLRALNLKGCDLIKGIDSIAQCKELTYLNLSQNHFHYNKNLIDEISKLSHLRTLYLDGCCISEVMASYLLSKMPTITLLSLRGSLENPYNRFVPEMKELYPKVKIIA